MRAMSNCLFCKIVSGEIPSSVIYQDDQCVGFLDVNPQAPFHALFVPRKHITTINDATAADTSLLGHLMLKATEAAKAKGLGDNGFRLVLNCNRDGGQSVFHIHLHVLGGRPLGWPPG